MLQLQKDLAKNRSSILPRQGIIVYKLLYTEITNKLVNKLPNIHTGM